MAEPKFTDILYETKNGVAKITINREKTHNSLLPSTVVDMVTAIELAERDKTIGVIVITGAGDRAFCSGGDVNWEKEGGLKNRHIAVNMRILHEAVRHAGKPVIAAVKGYAIGMGNHFAYSCDLTIAADNAIFGQNGARIGSPAEGWIVSYSVRVAGAKKAREMWMLCRKYNAQQALEMGLCNVVVPLAKFDEEVDKWCQEILDLSPTVLKVLKTSFEAESDYLREPAPNHFLKLVAPDFFDTPEAPEGQNAFLEKRKPNFRQFRK
ncbi:MAG: enoyl-CoA hydratase/isomerase family protein [Betaproteobacteria bacterium]|nr:enoyl-CoA hydratase/isomerase family protein [Betaproteobacteria bacterium]